LVLNKQVTTASYGAREYITAFCEHSREHVSQRVTEVVRVEIHGERDRDKMPAASV
jgi:hypothetical protein